MRAGALRRIADAVALALPLLAAFPQPTVGAGSVAPFRDTPPSGGARDGRSSHKA